jgi:hypothetical protein
MGRVDLPPPETNEGYPPPADDELVITIERDWTVEEERKAKRKYEAPAYMLVLHHLDNTPRLDLLIMPLLTLGFFCLRMSSHP